jgi:hypothetical protein
MIRMPHLVILFYGAAMAVVDQVTHETCRAARDAWVGRHRQRRQGHRAHALVDQRQDRLTEDHALHARDLGGVERDRGEVVAIGHPEA